MKKESRFLKPEANIVQFCSEDIIVTSDELWGDEYDVGGGTGDSVPHN